MSVLLAVPVEFWLFGLTLLGVATLPRYPLRVAAAGLAAICLYKLGFDGFETLPGLHGLLVHISGQLSGLVNLLLLLLGFAVLSDQFEQSKIPDAMPALLPDNWTGGAMLLGMIFLLSTFLDNIAAALVGGIIARHVYRGQVNIGFLAAIVTASNAGGAGSVIGDTTTTLMWINGIPPLVVARAFLASTTALLVVAFIASWSQHKYAPITKHMARGLRIEWTRGAIVFLILAAAVCANVGATLWCPSWRDRVPFIGLAVWAAILLTTPVRRPDFKVLAPAFHGALFLLCLVTAASMMPVDRLPVPSWPTALGLGFVSAVFNNIPLIALTLKQGGYDWAFLAYSVGVGGSILWFGSSAGVALVGMYPEAGSARNWLRRGWYVPLAYLAGFALMLAVLGWHPSPPV